MPETAKRTARVPILGEDGRISDDYIPAAIGEGVESAEAAATRAETAATAAEGSSTAASQSASGAQGSASAASTSATQAQESAATASGAATQAQSAQQAAEAAKTAAETAQSAAAGSAQDAQQSATAAAESAASVADKFITSAQATTLEPGSQATASVENQVLAIGVPKGEKGDKGDPGQDGADGTDGVTPFTQATVTTLEPGVPATVTIEEDTLKLGVPKGDPGDVSAVQTAEGSDLSVSTDEGTVTIDDSALRARISELEQQTQNVVTGTVTDLVAHGEDAYAQKPREVRVKGKTWVNRWPYIKNYEVDGIVVTMDETGLIHISGTVTTDKYVTAGNAVGVAPSKPYTIMVSSLPSGVNVIADSYSSENVWLSSIAVSSGTTATGTTHADMAQLRCMFLIKQGTTVNASFRVMLVDGTEAPDCFTPPASITSAQPENLVTSGKNLFDYTKQVGSFFTGGTLSAGTYTMSLDSLSDWWTENEGTGRAIYWYMYDNLAAAAAAAAAAVASGGKLVGHTDSGSVIFAGADIGVRSSATFTTDTSGCILFIAYYGPTWIDQVANIQLELGSTATAYEPPTITQTPLPEVELRSLPNGICDELVIRADGTCEVERKLGKNTIDAEHPITITNVYPAAGDNLPYVIVDELFPGFASYEDAVEHGMQKYVHSSTWPYVESIKSRGVYRSWNAVVFSDERFADAETAQSIINETGGTFIAQVPATTEPQSPVTLPALPAPTFNQYHDAGVPSDTSTEYVRDINIVLDNLAKQVAGTASAVAVREASTIEEE